MLLVKLQLIFSSHLNHTSCGRSPSCFTCFSTAFLITDPLYCVFQMYLSAKEKAEEQRTILERQKHLEEVLRQKRETEAKARSESITDQEMVDSIFGFLPPIIGGQEGQAPVGFEVWEPNV